LPGPAQRGRLGREFKACLLRSRYVWGYVIRNLTF